MLSTPRKLTLRQVSYRLNQMAQDDGVYFGSERVKRFYVSFGELYAHTMGRGNHIPVRGPEHLKSGTGNDSGIEWLFLQMLPPANTMGLSAAVLKARGGAQ